MINPCVRYVFDCTFLSGHTRGTMQSVPHHYRPTKSSSLSHEMIRLLYVIIPLPQIHWSTWPPTLSYHEHRILREAPHHCKPTSAHVRHNFASGLSRHLSNHLHRISDNFAMFSQRKILLFLRQAWRSFLIWKYVQLKELGVVQEIFFKKFKWLYVGLYEVITHLTKI